jgi:dihydroorotase
MALTPVTTHKSIIVRNVRITDRNSPLNGKSTDMLLADGVVTEIGTNIPNSSGLPEFSIPGLHVSKGWIDLQAEFGEPGFEQRETIESGAQAAMRGGFTDVILMPSTNPVNDQRSITDSILKTAADLPVRIHPAGSVSKGMEGKELSEMYEQSETGVKLFTDHRKTIRNSRLLQLAITYTAPFGGVVMHRPDDPMLSAGGLMHEGEISVSLGMRGIPDLAEELGILRDSGIAEYCNAPLILSMISSGRSVEKIRQIKSAGIKVHASAGAAWLRFTDNTAVGYDSLYKSIPPFRSESDKAALIQGLCDGTIDLLCSDHTPLETEMKQLEFEYSAAGMSMLETFYPVCNEALGSLMKQEDIIACFCDNPRNLLGVTTTSPGVGADTLTFFTPDAEWIFSESASASKNTPMLGQTLRGRAVAILNKGEFHSF